MLKKWEESSASKNFVGKFKIKMLSGRPQNSLVDDIKMDLGAVGWEGIDCIMLALDRDKL
jgi:hypothetical protein